MNSEDRQDIRNITDRKPDQCSEDKRRLIAFSLGDEKYCVDVKDVKEVIKLTPITKVPYAPAFIVGVINLRGEILSVLDIKQFIGLGKSSISEKTRILISDWQGELVGLMVDEMKDTIDLNESLIQPPLPTWKGKGGECVEGEIEIDGQILILINFKKVLGSQEIKTLKC